MMGYEELNALLGSCGWADIDSLSSGGRNVEWWASENQGIWLKMAGWSRSAMSLAEHDSRDTKAH